MQPARIAAETPHHRARLAVLDCGDILRVLDAPLFPVLEHHAQEVPDVGEHDFPLPEARRHDRHLAPAPMQRPRRVDYRRSDRADQARFSVATRNR